MSVLVIALAEKMGIGIGQKSDRFNENDSTYENIFAFFLGQK